MILLFTIHEHIEESLMNAGITPKGYSAFKLEMNDVENRKEAIEFGYNLLGSNDILCVLGKGAEDFQKIDGERIAYSDIDEVKRVLKI